MLHITFSIQQPISFVSAGTFLHEEQWIHSERVIDSFEIIIGVEGVLYLQQGEERYEVREGNMLLLLPGMVHRGYQAGTGKTSFFWFHFLLRDYALLEENEVVNQLWHMSEPAGLQSAQDCALPLYCPLKPDAKLDILFHQLLHVNSTPCYTGMLCNYLLTALLIQLCQNYLNDYRTAHEAGRSNRSFAEILEWVRMRCDGNLRISDVAEKFNYNENYFSRMFRDRTGTYFTDYVNGLRLSRAKSLLYRTNLTIKEIAWQVGFTDEKYFMKVFKKAEGISPTQYRNAFYLMHQNVK